MTASYSVMFSYPQRRFILAHYEDSARDEIWSMRLTELSGNQLGADVPGAADNDAHTLQTEPARLLHQR